MHGHVGLSLPEYIDFTRRNRRNTRNQHLFTLSYHQLPPPPTVCMDHPRMEFTTTVFDWIKQFNTFSELITDYLQCIIYVILFYLFFWGLISLAVCSFSNRQHIIHRNILFTFNIRRTKLSRLHCLGSICTKSCICAKKFCSCNHPTVK